MFSQKDLSLLVAELEEFLLKPIDKKDLIEKITTPPVSINFKISSHKNILEVKEKEEIKNGRKIIRVVISFYQIIFIRFYHVRVFLRDEKNKLFSSSYFSLVNPLISFEFDFKKNIKLKKKSPPLFLKIDEITNFFTEDEKEEFLNISGFPYLSKPLFFPLRNFEFGKHSLIVGQTGVGKSKFIELFVKKLSEYHLSNEYRIIIVDPHASLYPQFLNLSNKINFDFVRLSCDLFPSFSEPKIATELTILLFKTLLKEQFNAKMERVLKYVVYILFLKNRMSLFTLKRFLTELELRKEILSEPTKGYEYLNHFFDTEFVEMETKFYEIAIMPILVLIDELSFIPAFSNETPYRLEKVITENFLTCFSLNRIFLGDKATRLIAGLIIQQLFLIAQKRKINKKLILIIDEVSLVENESMVSILSEARKFNLSLFLAQQYLTQITSDLLRAILSNVYNYFVFKISDEDAKILIKNLEIKFPDEILLKAKGKGLSEENLKRELLVNLNPRELVVRVFSQGKFFPCFKAKTLTI